MFRSLMNKKKGADLFLAPTNYESISGQTKNSEVLMQRKPRTLLPGYPHHIIQRGHDRKPVFNNDRDYL